jgi:hypothetical protein
LFREFKVNDANISSILFIRREKRFFLPYFYCLLPLNANNQIQTSPLYLVNCMLY